MTLRADSFRRMAFWTRGSFDASSMSCFMRLSALSGIPFCGSGAGRALVSVFQLSAALARL